MIDETKLTRTILHHWQTHQPRKYRQLMQENQLEAELEATTEQIVNLVHHLTMRLKQSPVTAWEIATHQILQGEPEEDETPARLS